MLLPRKLVMINNLSELVTFNFWKGYWITMRPYLLFVSAVAGMVGFVVGPQRGVGVSLAVSQFFFFLMDLARL